MKTRRQINPVKNKKNKEFYLRIHYMNFEKFFLCPYDLYEIYVRRSQLLQYESKFLKVYKFLKTSRKTIIKY